MFGRITSYNVCYTKLLRDAVPGQHHVGHQIDAARHPRGILDLDVLRPEDRAHRLDQHQADAPGREQCLERAPVEIADHAALERHAHQRGGDEGGGNRREQVVVERRITSYNVCYTKLLRYVSPEKAQQIIDISKSFNIDAKIVGRVEASATKKLTITSEFGCFEY